MGGTTGGDDHSSLSSGPSERGLPGWASRHLAESGDPTLRVMPAAPSAGGTGRHRRPSRPHADPGRLRGWGLAVVAVAAAAAAVPLAVTTLARDEVPMPRVGAFPVASPADLGAGPDLDRGPTVADPGPDAAAVLPPREDTPVAPTASTRALPAEPAPAPAPVPVAATEPTVETTTTPPPTTTTTPPAEESAPADPTPRENSGTDGGSSDDDSDGESSGGGSGRGDGPGLVGGLVNGVGGAVNGLLG